MNTSELFDACRRGDLDEVKRELADNFPFFDLYSDIREEMFIIACRHDHWSIIRWLCQCPKNINIHFDDNNGYTALDIACVTGNAPLVEYLFETFRPHISTNANDILWNWKLACESGNLKLIKWMFNTNTRTILRPYEHPDDADYSEGEYAKMAVCWLIYHEHFTMAWRLGQALLRQTSFLSDLEEWASNTDKPLSHAAFCWTFAHYPADVFWDAYGDRGNEADAKNVLEIWHDSVLPLREQFMREIAPFIHPLLKN